MPRRKDLETRRKILQLWQQGIRKPSEIAERLGLSANRVRVLMCRMRKEGLLPTGQPHGDLLDAALTELRGAFIIANYLFTELLQTKHGKDLDRLRQHVERALNYISLYTKMRGLVK